MLLLVVVGVRLVVVHGGELRAALLVALVVVVVVVGGVAARVGGLRHGLLLRLPLAFVAVVLEPDLYLRVIHCWEVERWEREMGERGREMGERGRKVSQVRMKVCFKVRERERVRGAG